LLQALQTGLTAAATAVGPFFLSLSLNSDKFREDNRKRHSAVPPQNNKVPTNMTKLKVLSYLSMTVLHQCREACKHFCTL